MMAPQLVTIAGASDSLRETLTPEEYRKVMSGQCTAGDVSSLERKYPELMGFLPLVASLLPSAARAAKKEIQYRLKKGKKSTPASSPKALLPEPQSTNKKSLLSNPLVLAGGAAALLGIIFLTSKKR